MGWNRAFTGGATVALDAFNVEIHMQAVGHVLQLDYGQILLGLYEIMVDISAQSRFCEVFTTLSLYGRRNGFLSLENKRPKTLGGNETNLAEPSLLTGAPQSIAATYPSGSIADSYDQRVSLSYTYSDLSINSKDVFLAIIDGLVVAGQSSPGTPFESLNAMSPSGDCVISIVAVDQANYSHATTALRLIRDITVTLKKFGEVTFELKFKKRTMAAGSVKLASHRSEA